MSLHTLGAPAEVRFRRVTGAVRSPVARDGDALLGGRAVEVKRTAGGSVNQVRAVKFIPLVVWVEPVSAWLVVPPDEVVRLAARRRRGQHTECPFESCAIGVREIESWRVEERDLRAAVLVAFESGDRHPELREAMGRLVDAVRAASELCRSAVSTAPDMRLQMSLQFPGERQLRLA